MTRQARPASAPPPFDLDRFVDAQRRTYDDALAELRAGYKHGHWMWFVFPQLRGLGRSETSHRYGLSSVAEAAAYAAHPVLGARLRACCEAVLDSTRDAVGMLGWIDARKLRSCMSLFHLAVPDEPLFQAVLDRFYGGAMDPMTEDLLARIAS
jgi:uncharacterized protein (DUF1810 family)